MASTSITILKEYLDKETYTDHDYELFAHALDYAPGMSEIGATLYYQLHDAAKEKQEWFFREHLQNALKIMLPIWAALGKPDSHERWREKLNAMYRTGYYWSDNCGLFISPTVTRS